MDAVTAYLNSDIDRVLSTETPTGCKIVGESIFPQKKSFMSLRNQHDNSPKIWIGAWSKLAYRGSCRTTRPLPKILVPVRLSFSLVMLAISSSLLRRSTLSNHSWTSQWCMKPHFIVPVFWCGLGPRLNCPRFEFSRRCNTNVRISDLTPRLKPIEIIPIDYRPWYSFYYSGLFQPKACLYKTHFCIVCIIQVLNWNWVLWIVQSLLSYNYS